MTGKSRLRDIKDEDNHLSDNFFECFYYVHAVENSLDWRWSDPSLNKPRLKHNRLLIPFDPKICRDGN